MSAIGTITTRLSIEVAHVLRPFPFLLRAYLKPAYDYVDWRWNDAHVCTTQFGAKMRCRLSDLIQRKIAYFGLWEPNLTDYFSQNISPGDVVVDVGANIGYFTLLASNCVGGSGKVVAIEASPKVFGLLSENIALNRKSNIRAVNVAAGYARGELPLFSSSEDNIGHTSTVPHAGNVQSGTVQALPLQEILTEDEKRRVRLIKIDIEGAERPVLQSILDNLAIYPLDCEIAAELSPANGDFLATLKSHGFHAYELPNDCTDRPFLERRIEHPRRFTGTIEKLTDFVFSRRDMPILKK
jgi:FkbM family methyltransferase